MRSLVLPLALTLLAAPAGAQLGPTAATPALDSAATAPAVAPAAVPAPVVASAVSGAPVADAAVGLRPVVRLATDEQAQAAYQRRARRRGYGRSIALMASGGAAVVLGALAGGNAGGVLILGGAVVGLIGLYDYLR